MKSRVTSRRFGSANENRASHFASPSGREKDWQGSGGAFTCMQIGPELIAQCSRAVNDRRLAVAVASELDSVDQDGPEVPRPSPQVTAGMVPLTLLRPLTLQEANARLGPLDSATHS